MREKYRQRGKKKQRGWQNKSKDGRSNRYEGRGKSKGKKKK